MTIKHQLDPILKKWDLLKHPFYQAWSAGTLPVEALRVYAREYGGLMSALPLGWETLQDSETAEEEREHAELWEDFRVALGPAETSEALVPAAQLVETARRLFSDPASALGALYAFEAQQPQTAQSKLTGLKAHYNLPPSVEPYFEVHSANWHESAKLLAQMEQLSPQDRGQALAACEEMAESLWNALSGIHEATCQM